MFSSKIILILVLLALIAGGFVYLSRDIKPEVKTITKTVEKPVENKAEPTK